MTRRSRRCKAAAAVPNPATDGLHQHARSACTPRISSPKTAGNDYELSPYLEVIKDFRNDFTVISGLSHPDVDGGHSAEASYLTAAPHPRADSFRNTISLDQFAIEKLVRPTRGFRRSCWRRRRAAACRTPAAAC